RGSVSVPVRRLAMNASQGRQAVGRASSPSGRPGRPSYMAVCGGGRPARVLIWLFVAMTFSGCTSLGQWARNGFKVGPNHEAPPAPAAADWVDSNPPGVSNSPAQDRAWWTVFNDPTLNELIETAFEQNLDLQTAGMRILEARAQRGIAAGNLFP